MVAEDAVFTEAKTPKAGDVQAGRSVPLSPTFWFSLAVLLLLPFQFGWSVGQLNLTTFNDEDECNARPLVDGTCLMFPGHSSTEWTLIVNAWIVGGMIGSLGCGVISERFGRKKVLLANAVVMLAGAVIQASTSSISVFMVGRIVAGIASGCATGMVGGYISEITPPSLRNSYGTFMQVSLSAGILVVTISFFFADTSSGWRYIAAFPVLNAGFFLAFAPFVLVESPAWLLEKGDREHAEREIARLYGFDFVPVALTWMEPGINTDLESEELCGEQHEGGTLSLLFSPLFIKQLLVALGVSAAQQLTGINAVCYYSSDIFSDAGMSDGRVGGVIVATGITLALALSVEVLSIVFMDEYKFVPFMVTTAAFFFFTQFWIPETAGKSTEEIQATFRSRKAQKPVVVLS
ncbi:Major Facilitator Superfamily (MFS) [Phytophthora infestans T30-4]|uniref:Hexose transporter 1 n=1 Tax=Phytophthora infestans (strain T30-4) TaxID=403677 RepID=D0NK19_PHYIT|nr:Major Facilitator Superfamily (MFS) [Phytophthora infestans T30-4]EEY59856.1 Major Facilitator Superfamily (MFS) [Phytophthora infestans T30-4]|eukprot:XP_002900541.1 Major Facilitator Superfamily (MFS) [Phytophthora infestans T30-4]